MAMSEADESTDPEEIKHEYLSLREVYRNMLGGLYPSIAYNNLLKLRDRYSALRGGRLGSWEDLPPVPQPDDGGHVGWFP